MKQKDLNVWIERLFDKDHLSLEDLCGETDDAIVTIVGKESNEDRFIDEVAPHQFLKVDVKFWIDNQLVIRTVYNGMLPTVDYLQGYSLEQIFLFEMSITAYFNQIGSGRKHYWTIPVVEHDLSLFELLNLEEVVLPSRSDLPCSYEDADVLWIYRKTNKPTWGAKASALGNHIAKYGLVQWTFKDAESESTVFIPLIKVQQYSSALLDGYIRVGVSLKRRNS